MATNSERLAEARKKRGESKSSSSSTKTYRNSEKLEKLRLEREIDFDTFETDLKSVGTTINGIYGGWQTQETMANTKATVEAMHDRISKFQTYQSKFGSGDNADFNKVAESYKATLGDWDNLSSMYGRYKNAEAFNSAKKKAELDEKFSKKNEKGERIGLSYDEVQSKLKEYKEDSDEYKYLKNYTNYTDLKDFDKAIAWEKGKYTNVEGKKANTEDKFKVYGNDEKAATKQLQGKSNALLDVVKSLPKTPSNGIAIPEVITPEGAKASRDEAIKGFKSDQKITNDIDEKYIEELERARNKHKLEYGANDYYEHYREEDDFAELSKYKKTELDGWWDKLTGGSYNLGYGDVTYEYINDIDGARSKIKNAHSKFGMDTEDYSTSQEKKGYDKLNKEEIETYNYLYAKNGKEAAQQYLDSMEIALTKRVYDESTQTWKDIVENPVGAAAMSALSVPMNLVGGMSGALEGVTDFVQGKEYNPYSYYKMPSNFASDTRGYVGENIAEATDMEVLGVNVPSFLYQTGMSVADSHLGANTLGSIYSVVAGSNAFQQTAKQMKEEGESDDVVFANALSNGLAEMVFEKLSIDNFIKIKNVDSMKSFAIQTLKQAGIEASEEFATEFANIMSDKFIRGDHSALGQLRADLIERGYSEEEAEVEAKKRGALQLGEALVGGLLSGLTMGGMQSVGNAIDLNSTGAEIRGNDRVGEMWDMSAMTPQESDTYKLYEQYAEKGVNADNISNAKLGNLYRTAEGEAIEVLNNKKAKAVDKSNAQITLSQLDTVSTPKPQVEKRMESLEKGEKTMVDGTEAKIQGIKTVDGELVVVTSQGEVKADDMVFTKNDSEIVAIAEGMSEARGNLLIAQYDGKTDVQSFVESFNMAYAYGETGFGSDMVLKNRGVLTESQAAAIYKSAMMTKAQERKQSRFKSSKVKIDDSIIDYTNSTTDGSKVNWNSLTTDQKASLTVQTLIAEKAGYNLTFTRSEVVDGKHTGANGHYNPSTNTVTLDVYAGRIEVTSKDDLLIPVASHEITHSFKQNAAIAYAKLSDYAMNVMAEKSGVSHEDLVHMEMLRLMKEHPEMEVTEEMAGDEIVARACEDMFANSDKVKELLNQMDENEKKTFVDKVKEVFKNVIDWINDLLSKYKSTSAEAKLLRQYKAEFQKMSKLWDEALTESIETHKQTVAAGIQDEFAEVKSNLEAQFSMRYWDKMKSEQNELLENILEGKTGYEFETNMDKASLKKAQALVTKTIKDINERKAQNEMMIFPTEVLGRVMSKNLSYGVSIDGTRICFRTVTFNHFNDMVQEIVGRPLNANEQLVVNEKLVVIAKEPQCLVCCVALDRKAYWEDVLWYMDMRDKYIDLWNKTEKTEEDFQKLYKKFLREKVDSIADKYRRKAANVEANNTTYANVLNQFLTEPLKGDDLKLQKKFKKEWENSNKTEDEAKDILKKFTSAWHPASQKKPTAEMERRLRSWLSWADSGVPLLQRSDLTTEEKIAELFNKTVAKGRETLSKDKGNTYSDGDIATQYYDLNKYAQSASWAKKADMSEDVLSELEESFGKPIDQSLAKYQTVLTYWNDIRKLKPSDVARLNHEYGLRFYSYSEFNCAFLVDNMQEFIDASMVGLKTLMYSKSYEGAKFFAPSGTNINVGVILEEDGLGGYQISKEQSTPTSFENLLALRDRYENVGIVAVATTKDMATWACKQPWIDVVIPFHTVRNSYGVSEMGWEDHKAEQEDKKPKKNKAGADLWQAFVQEMQQKELGAKEPSASIMPFEHNNDYKTYRELCAKRGVTPRFTSYLPENSGLTENEYMKLVNETRRSANDTPVVKPVFDESMIKTILDEFEKGGGYRAQYTIPDSEIESHAQEVAKDILRGKTAMDVKYGSAMSKEIARKKMSGEINADNVPRVHGQSMVHYSDRDSDGNQLTPEQVEFFKDSKVRDEDGNLKVMYHGTDEAGFFEFDPSKSDDGISLFVTDNRYVAATYMESDSDNEFNPYHPSTVDMNTYEGLKLRFEELGYEVVHENGEYRIFDPVDEEFYSYSGATPREAYQSWLEQNQYEESEATARYYALYVNATNPLVVEGNNGNWNEINFNGEKKTTRELSRYAKENGYDGLVINNVYDSGQYARYGESNTSQVVVVFNSNQLKSIYNEAPTQSNDIRYSDRNYEKLLERKEQELKEAREFGRRRVKEYRNRVERNAKIEAITKKAMTLNDWLTKNSKKEHVPEALKPIVVNFLNSLDFSSKRSIDTGGQNPTLRDEKFARALSKVHRMMEETNRAAEGDSGATFYGTIFPEPMVDEIRLMLKNAEDLIMNGETYTLRTMSLKDLETLDMLVSTLKRSVTEMNRYFVVKHSEGVANHSQRFIDYAESLGTEKVFKGAKGSVKKLLNWRNAIPYYAFKRFGDSGMAVFEAFQDGWDTFAFNVKGVMDYTEEAYTDKEVRAWKDEIKSITLSNGKKVQMTIPQIMSLYCLNKREQARRHIYEGLGIRVADIEAKKDIIRQVKGTGRLDERDVDTILDNLTDRQKAVADKLQNFMQTTCADWGNDVTMRLYGYKAFGEENYFPIKIEGNNLVTETKDNENSIFRLLNMSFTKAINEKARNTVVVSDIFDVFAQHTSDMAKYNAFALPVFDAFKWYNYSEKDTDTGMSVSVKEALENAFGKDGKGYVYTFLQDINGAQNVGRDTVGGGFFTNAKIASVAANLRVVALQPTSYLRAYTVLDGKYLSGALLHKPKIAKAEQYCGIALWKSMGYYDTNIQRGLTDKITHNQTKKEKLIESSMKGAEIADKLTWGYLWNACELEIRSTRKDLRVGSEEFNKAVGKRLREVIYRTQVVDSTMTRSEMMRGKDGYDKMLTAFASEPTLALNMLQDSFVSMKLEERRTGSKNAAFKKYGKTMARTLTAYVLTSAVSALVESGFDIFRDDDELEEGEFAKAYLANLLGNIDVLGKIPYVKEAVSIAKGFSSSRTDTQWMEAFASAVKGIIKLTEGKGNAYKTSRDMIKGFSYVTGLPFYSVWRDVAATLNKTDILTTEDLEEIFDETIGEFFRSLSFK